MKSDHSQKNNHLFLNVIQTRKQGFVEESINIHVGAATQAVKQAVKQAGSCSLPEVTSFRKANIGLGGLGGAAWIRK